MYTILCIYWFFSRFYFSLQFKKKIASARDDDHDDNRVAAAARTLYSNNTHSCRDDRRSLWGCRGHKRKIQRRPIRIILPLAA